MERSIAGIMGMVPASGGANGFDGVKARTGHAGRGFDTRRLHSVVRPLMRQRRTEMIEYKLGIGEEAKG